MKALIEFIARSLVDAPDQVQVTEVEGEQTTVLELKVAKEDLGKVIGKQGPHGTRHAHPAQCRFHQGQKRVVLEILE